MALPGGTETQPGLAIADAAPPRGGSTAGIAKGFGRPRGKQVRCANNKSRVGKIDAWRASRATQWDGSGEEHQVMGVARCLALHASAVYRVAGSEGLAEDGRNGKAF